MKKQLLIFMLPVLASCTSYGTMSVDEGLVAPPGEIVNEGGYLDATGVGVGVGIDPVIGVGGYAGGVYVGDEWNNNRNNWNDGNDRFADRDGIDDDRGGIDDRAEAGEGRGFAPAARSFGGGGRR